MAAKAILTGCEAVAMTRYGPGRGFPGLCISSAKIRGPQDHPKSHSVDLQEKKKSNNTAPQAAFSRRSECVLFALRGPSIHQPS